MLLSRKHIAVMLMLILSAVFSFPSPAHRHQRDTVMIDGARSTIGSHPLGQLDSLHYCSLADGLGFYDNVSWWNYNGYIATLSVEGGRLYLTKVRTRGRDDHSDELKDYLKDFVDGSGKVFASWFSGELECAKGEILFYDPDGRHDICESTIKLNIESGMVVGCQEFVNLKHEGRNRLDDLSKDIKAFPREKFSQTTRVLVTPIPARVTADGVVKQWSFKFHSAAGLTPRTEKKLVRELNRIFLKYDFDTYRDCDTWILSPRNIHFVVAIGNPSNKETAL